MSDIDSLEDMLAALETPSSNPGRGGRQNATASRSSIKSLPPDDDIDAFLNEIDQESKTRPPATSSASSSNRGPTQSVSRPVVQNQQPARNPAPSNASRNPAPSNAARPVASARPVSSAAAPVGDGTAELQSQGYDIHNNKGKWFTPAKTNKASDFRINGTTSTRVGFVHAITLRSLDDYGNPAKIDSPKDFIGVNLTHQETGSNVQPYLRDNGDCTYNCAFFCGTSRNCPHGN
jgi:hypothetical protein